MAPNSDRRLLAQAIFELIKTGLVQWSDGAVVRSLKLTTKGQALLCLHVGNIRQRFLTIDDKINANRYEFILMQI